MVALLQRNQWHVDAAVFAHSRWWPAKAEGDVVFEAADLVLH